MSPKQTKAQVLGLISLACVSQAVAEPPSTGLAPGFVHLGSVDATIAQDMRYAGRRNFTGQPVPGYRAGECILLREVAQALKRVQTALAARGYGLKVYDCYRPMRAVRSFVDWTQSQGTPGDERYYPRTKRSRLVALGYIASKSSHAKGVAVDLTMVVRAPEATQPAPPENSGRAPASAGNSGTREGSCIAPAAEREHDDSLDMGTGYDCFDTLSHTANPAIKGEPARLRSLLVAAMAAEGFENFENEWWHFTYAKASGAIASHDFEVVGR